MSEVARYIELYKTYHKTKNAFTGEDVMPGKLGKIHVDRIGKLIKATSAETLLDYGCGKGRQYLIDEVHKSWEVPMPTLYDPAIEQFSILSDDIFDGVICTDVLEHVPEVGVDIVLTDILKRAKKFVYLHISTRSATTTLTNGENAHCTVKPHEWWVNKIAVKEPLAKVYISTQLGYTARSIKVEVLDSEV